MRSPARRMADKQVILNEEEIMRLGMTVTALGFCLMTAGPALADGFLAVSNRILELPGLIAGKAAGVVRTLFLLRGNRATTGSP